MALKDNIEKWLNEHAESMGFFPVGTEISKRGAISVFIDSLNGITVKECSAVSRAMDEYFGSQLNGYSLVVSSAGLDRPLTHKLQFVKNQGREIEVFWKNGRIARGVLEASTDETLVLKLKSKGKKDLPESITVPFADIREVKQVILFK